MSQEYTVKQGDTMLSIASENAYPSWEMIWQRAENKDLRGKRDPQVLSAGDVIFLPDIVPEPVEVTSGQHLTLVAKSLAAAFRTTVLDEFGKPLTNCKYQLSVGSASYSGSTNYTGQIERKIDPKAGSGTLVVYVGKAQRKLVFNLRLGELDPVEKDSGVKARLNNLGFDCGSSNGALDAASQAALKNFQIVHRLPVTGKADDATKKRLVTVHDRR